MSAKSPSQPLLAWAAQLEHANANDTPKPRVEVITKNGVRYYRWTFAGRSFDVVSVTEILNVMAKGLQGWSAWLEQGVTIQAATAVYARIMQRKKDPLSKAGFALAVKKEVGSVHAHEKALTAAGNIGTQVHNRIDWTLKTDPRPQGLGRTDVGTAPPLSAEAARCFERWQAWRQTVLLEPICVEEQVYSETHKYGGTLDLLAWVDLKTDHKGKVLSIVDWKTSKNIYESHRLQAQAYSHAAKEMELGNADRALVIKIPKGTKSEAIEVVECEPREKLLPIFLAAKTLFEFWSPYQTKRKYRKQPKKKPVPFTESLGDA